MDAIALDPNKCTSEPKPRNVSMVGRVKKGVQERTCPIGFSSLVAATADIINIKDKCKIFHELTRTKAVKSDNGPCESYPEGIIRTRKEQCIEIFGGW